PGQNLLDAWPSMNSAARRSAIASLGHNLQQLHAITLPENLENPWLTDAVQVEGKAGDAYHVLPKFFPIIIDSLRKARRLDGALLMQAESFLAARLELFTRGEPVLVHSDIHFNNLIWDGVEVTLVDFEGAAAAPKDMELHTILRFTHHPEQFYRQGELVEVTPADLIDVLPVLQQVYPSLFDLPDLTERLKVYEVMWQLLQLHHFQPGHDFDPMQHLLDTLNKPG
ncbi:MAG TPA: phosphotransferase, partial [Pseudomonadales bacterium]|nr:phosphotransferase [Pseudomonadales bacterium]